MAGRVRLEVSRGVMQGKEFSFEEHDTFLFGRTADCHARLDGDVAVSRHHFILEANPPDARVRDLGSRNGTYVNGKKYGGRKEGETPEDGAKRRYPEVDLEDGDQIKVGDSVLIVRIEGVAVCCECGCAIADEDRKRCAWVGGTFMCDKCRTKLKSSGREAKAPAPVRCQKCGKNVSGEIGKARRGDYVCESCRAKAADDPAQLLMQMMRKAAEDRRAGVAPTIQGYEIGKQLGVGGFGAVYLATRKKDNEQVALKVMLSRVAVDEGSRKRFLREIDTLKSLRHKNIVPLIGHGSAGTAFYFIMEFCEGGNVAKLMRQQGGRLSLPDARPIMLQCLEGLAYAHSNGYVHRDLKPENILLVGSPGRWTAKVSDFGLGKNFEQAGFTGMTVTGSYAGTAPYMPREQVTNFKYVKPVSDVWSMGATFYAILTGALPRDFPERKDPIEVVLHGSIVPIRKRDRSIPKALAEVIDCALAEKTKDRYQDGGEMLKALKRAL